MVRQREDTHTTCPKALDHLVATELERMQRDIPHPFKGLGGKTFEPAARLIQPGHAFGKSTDPDSSVRRLFDMGNIIIRQAVLLPVGTVYGKTFRPQIQARQASFLGGDPEQRIIPVRKHTVQRIGRQAFRRLQESPHGNAIVAIETFFCRHPDTVLCIHGYVNDKTVGQTHLLGRHNGGKRQNDQETKGSPGHFFSFYTK